MSQVRLKGRIARAGLWAVLLLLLPPVPAEAQEARRRWERMGQMRREKFDVVLPEVMRENGIDMWITVRKEGLDDPLTPDLGVGYVNPIGYYIFTDRGGDRIERAALGISGYLLAGNGAYDIVTGNFDLRAFVAERDPERIGLNMGENIGAADGLSYTGYHYLAETLGEPWASRFVSAEKLVSDFRARRVASEIAGFAEAGEISRELAERALSNEIITPGVTSLKDVAWWLMDRLLERGLGSSFGFPSIYITGPEGVEAVSSDRIIQGGDVMMIDWGVCHLNFCTDMKRVAYVLRPSETEAMPGVQNAFDQAIAARAVSRRAIRPGITARENMDRIGAALRGAGFNPIPFNEPTDGRQTDVTWEGHHSVGNLGHGIGPSIATWNPRRVTFEVVPSNLLSIELFAYTAIPEWGGAKLRVPLEDDAVVTERGAEWLYPANSRLLLIKSDPAAGRTVS
ncbi:M24 family metallopeptidase [Candidatus Palauibacter sp.]|uniref:M24 family metallopeptidase n=1 Tax=Candidatus Palauibacter sp. TaxID=3101350 RepID=UPI003B01177B